MKKVILVTVLCFLGQIIANAQGVQGIEFKDTMQYDMGTFRPGEAAVHVFEFTNIGNKVFNIIKVESTCSCTATDWTRGNVQPGDSGQITVTFDTHEKQGEYAKGVNITTNAGEINLIIMVKVEGEPVTQPVKINPMPHVDPHAGHNH